MWPPIVPMPAIVYQVFSILHKPHPPSLEHGIKRIKQTEEAIKAQKERERVKIDRLVSIEKDVFDRVSSYVMHWRVRT
ncbi:hypothetical protein AG1IA_01792 [Rhizoctonia solani AG-1 IA]|uniref:Uncharacterized protein n=1 Tax=Thanatephorus cucumeris (strain AG1-IA) TaxID=983506 RepID=L8X4Z6_THACA|nr:hypothetical protein AG1IA_01792 [Rhizoctonia solani AG-1 IA]